MSVDNTLEIFRAFCMVLLAKHVNKNVTSIAFLQTIIKKKKSFHISDEPI